MVLIADSGSTKSSWALLDGKNTFEFNSKGINPIIQTQEEIVSVISGEVLPQIQNSNPITRVIFFGSGCTQTGKAILNPILESFFSGEISCQTDLDGSAIAAFGHKSGIVAILGTGSNSGLYKNGNMEEHTPSLGYILGDEGSGTWIGRQLLSDFLKNKMPPNLAGLFMQKYQLNETKIIEAVYRKPWPNRFLASFSPFISENISTSYCSNLIESGFRLFFERNICRYSGFGNEPLAFTGSVAYHFKQILLSVAKEYGYSTIDVIKNPIKGLINHYKTTV